MTATYDAAYTAALAADVAHYARATADAAHYAYYTAALAYSAATHFARDTTAAAKAYDEEE